MSTASYFAYGSNADPDRFRARVGDWISRRPARLEGYRLRFAASVRSEGGGGAVVDVCLDGVVHGVLYEITPAQMEAMDREEFDPSRDTTRSGRRVTSEVSTSGGLVAANLYTVVDDGSEHAPSARYLSFILRGLADAGHGASVLEAVLEAAAVR